MLRYQWRFNGTDLPGQTNASLAISDIRLADGGVYTVVVTDDIGPVTSAPALIVVHEPPVILVPPQAPPPHTVLQGSGLNLSVVATGAPPIVYRWLRDADTLAGQTNASLHVAGLQFSDSGPYTVVLTNQYGAATSAPPALIAVLADDDRDGMADPWEIQFNFATNNPADAEVDEDVDGLSNGQEYLAGTDPTNSLSYLQLSVTATGAGVRLAFDAVSNRTYTIQRSQGLTHAAWTNLAQLSSRPTNWSASIEDPTPATSRYYRVIIPVPVGP
jgi:hypothetical protein